MFVRRPGDVIRRPATAMHRLEVEDNARVLSLFFTGPKEREWGFDCPQGWRHWRDLVATVAGPDGQPNSLTGRGCGET